MRSFSHGEPVQIEIMENSKKEFWKQFAGSIVRKLFTVLGTAMVGHGWISEDQAEGLTSAEIMEYIVGALFILAPVAWSWAKVKFNVLVVRMAREARKDTPIADIQKETLEQKTFISSV